MSELKHTIDQTWNRPHDTSTFRSPVCDGRTPAWHNKQRSEGSELAARGHARDGGGHTTDPVMRLRLSEESGVVVVLDI